MDSVKLKSEEIMQQAIGRMIVCEDGSSHRVVNICPSQRYKDKCIINETDPDSETGYFVHTLSLVCQVMGKGVPSKDAMAAASRVWESMYYREMDQNKKIDRWKKTKSGLLLPN